MSVVTFTRADSDLLDLKHLTYAEREKIREVLEEDRKLMIKDRIRIG